MILMRANPLRGPWKSRLFLDHEMPMYEAIAIWAQKSLDFQAPPLPKALEMARPKNVTIFRAHAFQWPSKWMGGGVGGTMSIY